MAPNNDYRNQVLDIARSLEQRMADSHAVAVDDLREALRRRTFQLEGGTDVLALVDLLDRIDAGEAVDEGAFRSAFDARARLVARIERLERTSWSAYAARARAFGDRLVHALVRAGAAASAVAALAMAALVYTEAAFAPAWLATAADRGALATIMVLCGYGLVRALAWSVQTTAAVVAMAWRRAIVFVNDWPQLLVATLAVAGVGVPALQAASPLAVYGVYLIATSLLIVLAVIVLVRLLGVFVPTPAAGAGANRRGQPRRSGPPGLDELGGSIFRNDDTMMTPREQRIIYGTSYERPGYELLGSGASIDFADVNPHMFDGPARGLDDLD